MDFWEEVGFSWLSSKQDAWTQDACQSPSRLCRNLASFLLVSKGNFMAIDDVAFYAMQVVTACCSSGQQGTAEQHFAPVTLFNYNCTSCCGGVSWEQFKCFSQECSHMQANGQACVTPPSQSGVPRLSPPFTPSSMHQARCASGTASDTWVWSVHSWCWDKQIPLFHC